MIYRGIQTITNTHPKRLNITAITGGHGYGKTRLAMSTALERFVETGKDIIYICHSFDYDTYHKTITCYDYNTLPIERIKLILNNYLNHIVIIDSEIATGLTYSGFDIKGYLNTGSEYIITVQRFEYLSRSIRDEISIIKNIYKGEL